MVVIAVSLDLIFNNLEIPVVFDKIFFLLNLMYLELPVVPDVVSKQLSSEFIEYL